MFKIEIEKYCFLYYWVFLAVIIYIEMISFQKKFKPLCAFIV